MQSSCCTKQSLGAKGPVSSSSLSSSPDGARLGWLPSSVIPDIATGSWLATLGQLKPKLLVLLFETAVRWRPNQPSLLLADRSPEPGTAEWKPTPDQRCSQRSPWQRYRSSMQGAAGPSRSFDGGPRPRLSWSKHQLLSQSPLEQPTSELQVPLKVEGLDLLPDHYCSPSKWPPRCGQWR